MTGANKKRMQFMSSIVLLIALVASLLAGCGPTTAPEATEAPAAEEPAATEAPAPTEPSPTEAPAPTEPPPTEAPPAAEGPSGTLTVVQALLPITADPHIEYLNSSWAVNYALYDPLARVDEEAVLKNYLAESWELETPTTWIYHLRQGVNWHDGEPFTSEDVVFSIERIMDPETASIWGRIYSYVTDVEAIDDYTVRFTTAFPTVALPQDFGRMCILPKHAFEAMGKDEFFQNPIGTGPFKFVSQIPGEEVVMEANEDYWGGPPKIKTLIIKQVPEAAARVAELLSGTADLVDGIPPNEVENVNNSDIAHVVAAPTVRRALIEFARLTTPELDDPQIRKAVALAIDADAINDAVYAGQGGRQTGWLDRHSWGYNKDLEPWGYDPEESKRLLAEAGYPDGMPITFMMGKGRFLLDEEVGLAIADYLSEGGFIVDFQIYEWGTFSSMRSAEELTGVFMLSSGNSTGEPDQVFRSFDPDRSAIYTIDEDLAELIHAQAQEFDLEKRAPLVAAVDAYIHENVVSYNPFTVPGFYGLNNRVENFVPNPFEIFNFYNLTVEE
jgi:peptide/nickel transport system substrate-binding protein